MRLFDQFDRECPANPFRVNRAEMFRHRIFDSKSDATQSTNTQTGSGGAGTSGKNSPASAADSILLGSRAVGARDNAVVIAAGKDLNSGTQYNNKGAVNIYGGLSSEDMAFLQKVAASSSTAAPAVDYSTAVDAGQIGGQNFIKDFLSAATQRGTDQILNPQTWPAWVKPALIAVGLAVVAGLGWLLLRKKKKNA